MRFAAKEDIAAPIDRVFAALTDFESFERLAIAKGAEVTRTDRMPAKGAGMTWDTAFRLRGRKRRVALRLSAYEPTSALRITGQSPNLDIAVAVTLVALAPHRTRISVEAEILPRTLAARIVLQSARIGKARLTRKFQERVRTLARLIASRAEA